MIDSSKPPGPSAMAILHICSSSLPPSGEALAIEKWVVEAGLEVVRCDDLYMGLAKAMGKMAGRFLAVVVCVEDCSPDDCEFFSILAKSRRDLPVYVYGSRSPDRIVRALESGARGLASRDVVQALSSRLQWRTDFPVPDLEPAVTPSRSASPQRDFVGPVVESGRCVEKPEACTLDEGAASTLSPSEDVVEKEDEPHADPANDSDGEGHDDAAEDERVEEERSGARVPWLRYSGGPERKRPPSANENRPRAHAESPAPRTHASNGSAKTPPRAACERTYEPLLTEQELAALLGDDLDDTAMQEREMLTGEGEVPGSGTR